LVLNFIFHIFPSFFWREGVVRFRCRERKWSLVTIIATKTVDFGIKWFYLMRGVQIKHFFFFTLKVSKKTYLSLRRFWVSCWFTSEIVLCKITCWKIPHVQFFLLLCFDVLDLILILMIFFLDPFVLDSWFFVFVCFPGHYPDNTCDLFQLP
jgi:hypothetical protein